MTRASIPWLPFDIINIIASLDIPLYKTLLSLPRFARSTLRRQRHWQLYFTKVEIKEDHPGTMVERWTLNGRKHRLDGPAIMLIKNNATTQYYWYRNGVKHRDALPNGRTGPASVEYHTHPDYSCYDKHWVVNGKLHRTDGPAIVRKDCNQQITREWYQNGTHHRAYGPSIINVYSNGSSDMFYYKDQELHREGGPAIIRYSSRTLSTTWYAKGKQHRIDGPAHLNQHADGTYNLCWYNNGCLHRIGGPATDSLLADGTRDQLWYENGLLHRIDGPAWDTSKADGSFYHAWAINGEHVLVNKYPRGTEH